MGTRSSETNIGTEAGRPIQQQEGPASETASYRNPAYHALVQRMVGIHDAKSCDYASDTDPLSNLRMSERFGIPAWRGCLIRMSDKWSRLEQLASGKTAKVKGEAMEDTLLDLANYCLLCIILRGEKV